MFEIQSSQMALSKQADPDTKPFAEKMIQDHQKTSSELKALVEGSMVKLTLPASLEFFDTSYDQNSSQGSPGRGGSVRGLFKKRRGLRIENLGWKTLPHLKEHLSLAENLK